MDADPATETHPAPAAGLSEAEAFGLVMTLFTPMGATDPHPLYRKLRDAGVVQVQTPMAGIESLALVSRHDDVHHALRHPDVFASAGAIQLGSPRPLIPLQVDPPDHAKYRRLLDPLFSPKATEAMEADVRALATRLLDTFTGRDACDFHAEFAVPFPCTIFLQLMGLPLEELDLFLEWKDGIIRPSVDTPFDNDAVCAARDRTGQAIDEYFEAAIEQRRRRPADDLLTHFVTDEIDGERLDRDEILGICYLFLLGGLDTVTASLDCMVARLATHPEERQELVDDPSRIPSAIEELLRYETPVTGVPRLLTQPAVIAGQELPAGTQVMLLLGAADDDEHAFPHADVVDLGRDVNRHFAFGAGPHRCLGSHLARRELRVALEELHLRFPEYALAPGAELSFTPAIRQLDALPLVLGRPAA